jgi:hypothetical protein
MLISTKTKTYYCLCYVLTKGEIPLSTMKWFSKQDAIILEVKNFRNIARLHVHVLSYAR